MAGTKKKSGKAKAPSKPAKQIKAQSEAYLEELQHLPPQDHVAAVKPLWETLTPAKRDALLTVGLEELHTHARARAAAAKKAADADTAEALQTTGDVVVCLDPPLDEVLEEALARSKEHGTWKVWQWGDGDRQFFDSESFRRHLEEEVLTEEQRRALPREEEGVKPVEKPAEAALRKRMVALLQRVQEQRTQQEEAADSRRPSGRRYDPANATRDANIDLITLMLNALQLEHEALYHHVLHPVTACVCDALPEASRQTTRSELHYEDLEKLVPDDVLRIYDWMTEKVDALGGKLKPEASEVEVDEEEEPIGDVDLFSLVDAGAALRVDPKWMEHLQSRVLGEDGQPRRAKEGEDPHHLGLVLEWVYGTIVSTAEKSRDGAHRPLGGRVPSAQAALGDLTSALEEQWLWEGQARAARELLAELLASRKEAAELAERFDTRSVAATPPAAAAEEGGAAQAPAAAAVEPLGELSDHVVISMLKREALLTGAKLHFLGFEHLQADRLLHSLKAQLRQGEPEFERLKRELEEIKNAPRGLEGTYRTAAEMERHRSQLADAAIEEQIEVQTAFRETGARLQKILDQRREAELGMARREQEMKQLANWKATVVRMTESMVDVLAVAAPLDRGNDSAPATDLAALSDEVDEEAGEVDAAQRALVAAVKSVTRQGDELRKLRNHFHHDIRRQLYTMDDDRRLFDQIKRQLRDLERRLDDGRAVLQHLESFVINVACDDPGTAIGTQLILPYLQERLDAKALEYAAQRAAAAEDEVIRMELDSVNKERQEREKKAKSKARAKEKARSEREKERAEKEEREEKAKAEAETQRALREAEAQQAQRRRVQELEEQRRAEEEVMERRRQELLADKDSYWRLRLEQDELMTAQAALEQQLRHQAAEGGAELADSASDGDGFVPAAAKPVRRSKQEPRQRGERREEGPPANGAPRARPPQQDGRDGGSRQRLAKEPRDGRAGERSSRRVVAMTPITLSPPQAKAATPTSAPMSPPSAPMSPAHPDPAAIPPPPTPQEAGSAPTSPVKLPPAPVTPDGQQAAPAGGALPPPLGLPGRGGLPAGAMPMPVGMPLPHGRIPTASMAMPPLRPGSATPGASEAERPPSAGPDAADPLLPPMPPGSMPAHVGMPPYGAGPYPPHPHMGRGMPPRSLLPGMLFFQPMPPPGAPPPLQMLSPNGQPGQPFVLPGGLMPMPGMMPVPVHMMHPSMRGRPAFGSGATQLRAAAQPFVPGGLTQQQPAQQHQPQQQPGSDGGGAKPSGDSPRGILEPAGPSGHDGGIDEVGSGQSASEDASVHAQGDNAEPAPANGNGGQQQEQEQQGNEWARRGGMAYTTGQIMPPPAPPPPRPAHANSWPAQGAAASLEAAANGRGGPEVAVEADVRRLKLVRGLTNAPGLYNCFLNVIIQALWHLPSFRRTLLALTQADVQTQTGPPHDVRVFSALWGVFRALEAAVEGPAQGAATAPSLPVSPRELREALSTAAAARFELSDMHDAAEVLGEIFDCLHRAELGVAGGDPTLPRQVQLALNEARGWAAAPLPPPPPPPRSSPLSSAGASPVKGAPGGTPPGAGSVWANSAALQKVKRAPPPALNKSYSMVQRLFGLEVQVPAAASADGGPSDVVQCQQFTKYFHLVPAQGLRRAATSAATFEDALLAADAAGAGHLGHLPAARLLSRPQVLTLGIVWESPQAPAEAIAATMRALDTQLAPGSVFAGADDAGTHRLRGVVCYSRSHYSAFALSEELGQWLLLDDADVSVVGAWAEVGAAVLARRLQPSLLFYEAEPREE